MLTSLQHNILEVLNTQSEGYLCSPFASAFVAVGLEDVEEIEQELIKLQNDGLVEFYYDKETHTLIKVERDSEGNPVTDESGAVKPILDEDGKLTTEDVEEIVDSGWIITDEGKKWLDTPK